MIFLLIVFIGVDFGEVVLCGSLGAVGHPKPEASSVILSVKRNKERLKSLRKIMLCFIYNP